MKSKSYIALAVIKNPDTQEKTIIDPSGTTRAFYKLVINSKRKKRALRVISPLSPGFKSSLGPLIAKLKLFY
jgi:hypothetical protein